MLLTGMPHSHQHVLEECYRVYSTLIQGAITPSEDMPFVVYPLFKGVALQLLPCPAPRRHFLALVGLFVV